MASSQEANFTPAAKSSTPDCGDVQLDPPVTFDQVLEDELTRINRLRAIRNLDCKDPRQQVPVAHKNNLIGLAFSGGGIRSATFHLGFLQGLAQKKLLRKFDYLSTVSGGGYIGSWLAAFTKRMTSLRKDNGDANTFADVEAALSPSKYEVDERSEPPVVHWLRLYSNYLTPHTGVVSGDTWAMLGTWLRNTTLNQTIFGLSFISLFVVCNMVLLWLVQAKGVPADLLLVLGGFSLLIATLFMAFNVVKETSPEKLLGNWYQRFDVTVTVMIPFVVACILLNCAFWRKLNFSEGDFYEWPVVTAAFYFVVWGFVGLMAYRTHKSEKTSHLGERMISVPALLISSPVAGAVGGCLFWAYMSVLNHIASTGWSSKEWVVVTFGSGVMMTIMLLVGMLHIGLVGRGSADVVREWWSRLGGYLKLFTLNWLLLSGTCVFAPLLLRWTVMKLAGWKSATVGLLWLSHNYLGVSAAKSAKTSGNVNDPNVKKALAKDDSSGTGSSLSKLLSSPKVLNALAKSAPYVFLVGLVLLLSTAVQIGLGLAFAHDQTVQLWFHHSGDDWASLAMRYWAILEGLHPDWLLAIWIVFLGAALGLSWRVDVNDFSLHHFYRNRLVRCYLGASNPERHAEPFTGFDPDDDFSLCSFADDYPGPYPILNAALNITGGEELGYATRRAKSFAFTPLRSGYVIGAAGKHNHRFTRDHAFQPSYARTEQGRAQRGSGKLPSEAGITLGTAMAISGAAASPNMGYHTSPATAFFMALFDVRLGWWMGNSRYADRWASTGPTMGFGYLFSELIGQADEKKRYVYLSDGGHFENLAVYELIRRRCRLIVSGDGDADSAYAFGDVLGLIEKARTDFGARIEIDYESIRPPAGSRECPKNFVVGTIYYDPNNCKDTGTLILIKASMPIRTAAGGNPGDRKLPDDVWQYYDKHSTFPHQTTADQWFDELQFESYRALGEYIGSQASRQIEKAVQEALDYPGS